MKFNTAFTWKQKKKKKDGSFSDYRFVHEARPSTQHKLLSILFY